jgi:DNA-binding NarL/FixJ family response regulator
MLSTRILIIDHHQDFLNTIVKMLRRDFTIVGALTDGATGLAFALALNPDILILDISLPDIDGVEIAKRLAAAQCRAKIIFLSREESPGIVSATLDSGASGYVFKSRIIPDLITAIAVALKDAVFMPAAPTQPKGKIARNGREQRVQTRVAEIVG